MALCLRKEMLNKNSIPRIIIEFLFLAAVLKKEFETDENVKNIKIYRKKCVVELKKKVNIQNIKYVDNTNGDYLNRNKVPETSLLLEIYCFLKLFSNDSFKTYLDKQINQKPNVEVDAINIDKDVNLLDYLKYVFQNEIFVLSLEEIKLVFGTPVSEGTEPKPESKNSNISYLHSLLFKYYCLPGC
ncbi:hypothetical protein CWI38_0126p0040 [Hamiltosporidium tvaerminnensis]|uniref:Uncharacterized protein n=1 Tax=Hamiltosporidium tvaerminnensis TaxID=1176355 RepID=A0A4V2JY86_9MICR|nr:hypothetical protein CWI38_0126p0040 [Hamiltosporidium tvaerminnensis]